MLPWGLTTILLLLIAAIALGFKTGPTLGLHEFSPLRPFELRRRQSSTDMLGYSEDHRSMRNLIRHVRNNRIFVQKNGMWADTCLWGNVFCNEEDQVIRINWSRLLSPVKLNGGSVDLSFIPPHVLHFDIGHTHLEGTLDAAVLPRLLREMHINYCNFHGTIDWSNLPENLEILNVSNNHFTGTVSLNDMPDHLFQLNISKNLFSSITGDSNDNRLLRRNRIIGITEIPLASVA